MDGLSSRIAGNARISPAISEALGKLTAEFARYFPDEKARPEILSVACSSRRLSDIGRVELKFSRSTTRIYVKVHKKPTSPIERVRQKARLEFDTLSYLYPRFQGIPGCSVVRPIAFFPQEMTVVTAAAEGENLHQVIKRQAAVWRASSGIEMLKAHCRSCGVWLRHFQEITAQQRREELPVSSILEQVMTDLEVCVEMGLRRADSIRLLAFCKEQLHRVEGQEFPVVGEHPDFQPDNILLSSDGVTVLDFTSFRYGSAYSDPGRFLASLDFLSKNPFYSRRTIHTLMTAFLQGYGWREKEMDPGLTVYLIRYMVQAVATVSTWPRSAFVKRFVERRAAAFLSAWSRRIISSGDDFVGALTLPSP